MSLFLVSHCSRFWDGWLCWDETPAGSYASQNCPDYPTFDNSGKPQEAIITEPILTFDTFGNWKSCLKQIFNLHHVLLYPVTWIAAKQHQFSASSFRGFFPLKVSGKTCLDFTWNPENNLLAVGV